MTAILEKELTATVPISFQAHQFARQFYHKHFQPNKAKQVYLNTLAVWSVNHYLNCLNVETDLEKSDSWNPVFQTLANAADLAIKRWGKLECRPVLPESQICPVPPEVWMGRSGYIAVRFNPALTEATLLGFVPEVSEAELPLSKFHSLETLFEALQQPYPGGIKLSRRIDSTIDAGWQKLVEEGVSSATIKHFKQVRLVHRFPEGDRHSRQRSPQPG